MMVCLIVTAVLLPTVSWVWLKAFHSRLGRALCPPRAGVVLFSYYSEDARPRREAEALLGAGFEVDILCLRRLADERLHENIGGANVYRLPLSRHRNGRMTYLLQYGCFLLASFTFLTFRSFRGYRLIHVHNMPDILVLSALVPRLLGARIILDLHDPVPELFRAIYNLPANSVMLRCLEKIERWSIRFADVVLTPNIAFKEVFVSRGCRPDKVAIVMNSPDETIFNFGAHRDRGKLPGFNLMFHGSLLERNGLFLAIDAVAQLRQRIPSLRLHIYGEPTPHIGKVMQKVSQLALQSIVEYHGYKLLREVPLAISATDLGVITNLPNSFNEINLPIRIFEYLSMGKPVIVPRMKGILDYFHEDELLFFKPGDSADLACKIEWACTNPLQLQELLKRGQRVYERHRWKKGQHVFVTLVQATLGVPPDSDPCFKRQLGVPRGGVVQ
jgi:glycosyltransferase involved in cell wall biosynthesis